MSSWPGFYAKPRRLSFLEEEGFARSIIEAMAAGLPIIATHQSGATTLVDDGVEGLIVRGRDVNQLAEAMIRVATDRESNEHMGRAAHVRGGRNNTWMIMPNG